MFVINKINGNYKCRQLNILKDLIGPQLQFILSQKSTDLKLTVNKGHCVSKIVLGSRCNNFDTS